MYTIYIYILLHGCLLFFHNCMRMIKRKSHKLYSSYCAPIRCSYHRAGGLQPTVYISLLLDRIAIYLFNTKRAIQALALALGATFLVSVYPSLQISSDERNCYCFKNEVYCQSRPDRAQMGSSHMLLQRDMEEMFTLSYEKFCQLLIPTDTQTQFINSKRSTNI